MMGLQIVSELMRGDAPKSAIFTDKAYLQSKRWIIRFSMGFISFSAPTLSLLVSVVVGSRLTLITPLLFCACVVPAALAMLASLAARVQFGAASVPLRRTVTAYATPYFPIEWRSRCHHTAIRELLSEL